MQSVVPQLFSVENSLGSLESEVMQVMWKKDKVTVRDVLNILKSDRPIAYTTVMTIMDHLYKKGFLERRKIEKSYYYHPIVRQKDVVNYSLSNVFDSLINRYGRVKIFSQAAVKSISPSIKIAINQAYYPIGYGISLTFLLTLIVFSAFDLPQNLSFFGFADYLSLLLSDTNLLSDKLHLVFYAILESLPIVNILTTGISFILMIILLRKLAKTLHYKISI